MGDFRMTVEAVGGHGCNRTAKEGQEAPGCGRMDCPDCVFAEFVVKMKKIGSVYVATLHHWPADMTKHALRPGETRCARCGATDEKQPNGEESIRGLAAPCRTYAEAQEVVDDLTERGVKYPGLLRATPVRVKGHF